MLNTLQLAIVDVETTGVSATYDRIIEIGIQRIERETLVATFSMLVNPGCRIPPEITRLTGITDDDVADAPVFSSIAAQIRALLDGCIFVAHNAPFDYGFVKHELERAGGRFSAACLCTVRLSRWLYPRRKRHGLSSLIERFGLQCERRHRALHDAAVVWQFLQHARQTVTPDRLRSALEELLRTPTLPPALSPEHIDALPGGPGVYIFYDAAGRPLYVGKSLYLRDRVLAHCAGDHRSSKTMAMCQHVARIETRRTAGELGALLLESHLINALRPLYNRRARDASMMMVVRRAAGRNGYATVRLEEIDTAFPLDRTDDVLAVCRSRREAKQLLEDVARQHRLCPRLLGLVERATGSCLHWQLGLCSGACHGKERPALYNARLAGAFTGRALRAWPYPGPVLIEESDPERTSGQVFVVHEWKILRAMTYDEQGRQPFLEPTTGFDYEQYRILVSHLLTARRRVTRLTPHDLERVLGDGESA